MSEIKRKRVAQLLSETPGVEVLAKGWVRTKRGNKNVAFLALNDGSCVANIQIVADVAKFDEQLLKDITTGACLRVAGRLVESVGSGQPVEIQDNGAKVVDSKEIAFMKEADERLSKFNWTSAGATYTELERYLRRSVSGRRAGDLINIASEKGIIYKSDKKKYHYNGLKELPKDNSQDLPFDAPNPDEKIDF